MSSVSPRLSRPAWVSLLAVALVVLLAATVAGWWLFFGATQRKVTAYFDSAVGVYPRGDVRVLGVPVGSISDVTPQGERVRVEMDVDRDVALPADASAVVVAPTVVSDRYVQLAPTYSGGPELSDGAMIPPERTATPVELDQVYSSLNEITKTLGPGGANSRGDLSKLLDTAAENLDGNGRKLATTLRHLGELGGTMQGSSEELFATVDNLQKFSSMLRTNDDQVRRFNSQLQEVSSLMADERHNLTAAMAELTVALEKVDSFLKNNREELKSNVDQLNTVAKTLVEQRAALDESLSNAPLALSNLANSYNGASGTLDTRAVINELNQPPLAAVCKLLSKRSPDDVPGQVSRQCDALAERGGTRKPGGTPAEIINSAQNGDLPPLPLLGGQQNGQNSGGGR
ncbi:MCE family protein [Salinifilum ghardaiensis]